MKYLEDIGSYFLMLRRTFSGFTKGDVLRELIFKEIDDLIKWFGFLYFPKKEKFLKKVNFLF